MALSHPRQDAGGTLVALASPSGTCTPAWRVSPPARSSSIALAPAALNPRALLQRTAVQQRRSGSPEDWCRSGWLPSWPPLPAECVRSSEDSRRSEGLRVIRPAPDARLQASTRVIETQVRWEDT